MLYNEDGDNMIPICEEKHVKRLKNNNIKIIEMYKKTLEDKNTYIRTIMDKKVDEITNCIRVGKEFYHNDKLIYKEEKYDTDIKYTFLDNLKEDKELECPSCGYKGPSKDYVAGCPYCQTDFTIDYRRKSNKQTTATKKTNGLAIFLGVFSFITIMMNIIMVLIFRYLNLTWFVGSILLFIISVLIFMFDAKHNHEVEEEDLWHEFKTLSMKINENRVFNDLYFQLSEIYYDNVNKGFNNLIDFEIIKYWSAQYDRDEKGNNILLTYEVRKFFFDGKKITKTETTEKVKLYRNQRVRHKKSTIYASRCKNCGSTLDKNKDECPYCGSKNMTTIGWVIDTFMEVKQKKKEL